ncbi:MAG: (2Fe-2S) ferredoxin domain-containing protein [Deltaproteobacteria bacterium]|nr:(2Fe-2S) ferredoxin domain-containing protein [Deltaproteobacteria bacterium]
MESHDSPVRQVPLQLYLCITAHCARRVVRLKIRTADPASREFNGPGLAQAMQELIVEKGLVGQVQVRETSCMRGCTIGPRLNVVGAGGFKEAVRYLHLPAAKSHLRCARWEDVVSLEALLDYHVQGQDETGRRAE